MLIIDTYQNQLDSKLKEIAALELKAIDLALKGKNFDHVECEMQTLTYKYLKECENRVKAPLEMKQRMSQPLSLNGDKKHYKDITSPLFHIYVGVELGQVFFVKEFANYTTRSLQGRLASALNRYNQVTGSAHAYESHRNKNEIRLKRVG